MLSVTLFAWKFRAAFKPDDGSVRPVGRPANVEELQSYFVKRIEKMLKAKGKRQEARRERSGPPMVVTIRRFAIEFAFPFGAQWTMAVAPVKIGRNKDGDEFGRRAAAP